MTDKTPGACQCHEKHAPTYWKSVVREYKDALEKAEQEPTDAEVGAVQKCLYERTLTWVQTVEVRAALSAARAARRDEETR